MIIRKEKSRMNKQINFDSNLVSSSINKYKVTEKLGSGTYGNVSKGHNIYTNELVGIKEFKYRLDSLHITTIRELRNLIRLKNKSKYIIDLLEIVITNTEIYAIYPFYDKTLDKIKIVDLLTAKKILKQLLTGVADMHANKVIHRDLKPHNIMIDKDENVKIIDFGMSRIISKTMSGLVVTLTYRAPELLVNSSTEYKAYGYDVDIWSLGIIFLEMLKGGVLFKHETDIALLSTLRKLFVNDDFSKIFSFIKNRNLLDLLSNMLRWKPIERISAADALEHDFFKDDNDSILPVFPSIKLD